MRNFIRQYRKPGALAAFLLIVVLVVVARYNFGTKQSIAPPPVNDTPVQDTAIPAPTGIVRTGSVETPISVPVTSGFSGRISDMYVTEGLAVKAGQPLFKMEPASGGSEAPTGGAPLSGQDSYDNALKEYTRYQKLYEQGAIPRRQLENAASRLQAAKVSLDSGQSASPNGTAALTAPAIITAPIDGIVTDLAAAAGNTMQAGQQVMALGSGQKVEIVVILEQKELYLVHLGTPATIEVADQAIMGQVSSIFPEVQEDKISSFLAHIKLTNPPAGLLKAGMSVKVRIDTGT